MTIYPWRRVAGGQSGPGEPRADEASALVAMLARFERSRIVLRAWRPDDQREWWLQSRAASRDGIALSVLLRNPIGSRWVGWIVNDLPSTGWIRSDWRWAGEIWTGWPWGGWTSSGSPSALMSPRRA